MWTSLILPETPAGRPVVVFHAFQYNRFGPEARFPYDGTAGYTVLHQLDSMVDWFFVLSAFLLYLPYARSVLARTSGAAVSTFLARRAVRIVPLYLVAVTLVWALRNPGLPGDWRDLLEHLTFTQVFDQKRIFQTIGPAWSLAVEVQFYVLLALVGSLTRRLGHRLASRGARLALLLAVPGGLAAVGAGYVLVVHDQPYENWPLWFGLPAKLVVFAPGMVVAVLVAARRPGKLPYGRAATGALQAVALMLLAAAFATRGSSGAADVLFHCEGAVAFALLVGSAALGVQRGLVHRALSWAPLAWTDGQLQPLPVARARHAGPRREGPAARAEPAGVPDHLRRPARCVAGCLLGVLVGHRVPEQPPAVPARARARVAYAAGRG